MSVFRFDNNTAPATDQYERHMIGEIGKKYFGPGGQMVLIEYPEATGLWDDREHTGILYTGPGDRHKALKEVTRLMGRHIDESPASSGNG